MILADKLENLRIEKGKTKQQVANETGLGITSIKNYENKRMNRVPDTNAIKKLAEYYMVSYDYLLDDECEAKERENINIGKELMLSDKSIENIKSIYECTRIETLATNIQPNPLNDFIENFYDIEHFFSYQSKLKIFYKIIYALDEIVRNIDIFLMMKKYLNTKTEKGQNEVLQKYFNTTQKKNVTITIEEFNKYIDTINEKIDFINKSCLSCMDILNITDFSIISNLKNHFQVLIDVQPGNLAIDFGADTFTQDIEDLQKMTLKNIGYVKYEITILLDDYLNTLKN